MSDQTLAGWHADAVAALLAVVQHHPDAAVEYYPGWNIRDLVVHVIRMHEMACSSLRDNGGERPSFDVRVDERTSVNVLAAELARVSRQLNVELDRCPHSLVWAPPGPAPPSFWRSRMVSEVVLHRWDAESALCGHWMPEHPLPDALIDEFVGTRLTNLPDDGRSAVTFNVGPHQWYVRIAGDGEARVTAEAGYLWLWLNHRVGDTGVEKSGSLTTMAALDGILKNLRRPDG